MLEDSTYSAFAYDGPPLPALKTLDKLGVAVYIGSLSKVLSPGLRVGYVVAEQTTLRGGSLADELSKAQSLSL